MEDEEGLEGFMATNDEEVWAKFQIQEEKRKRKIREQKGAVTNKVASNPFEKGLPAGSPIWPPKVRIPTTKAYWGKGKGKKWKKGKSKFQYPYPMTVAEEKADGHDKGQSKTFAATAEKLEESANQQIAPSTEPTYAGWTDQDWDPSWNWSESGW